MDIETRALQSTVHRSFTLDQPVNRPPLSRPADALVRAASALVAAEVRPHGDEEYLRLLGDDAVTPMLMRAAIVRATQQPATLSDTTWAGVLAQSAVLDFLMSIGPVSAAASILARSNVAKLSPALPSFTPAGIVAGAVSGGFVAEGDPIPVNSFAVLGSSITGRKLSVITAVSRDLAKRSNAEQMVRAALEESATVTFDAALFGAAASSDAAPAGLLNGVSPLSSDYIWGSTSPTAFILNSLAALAAAVAPVAFGDIVFVADPKTAAFLQLMIGDRSPFPILSTTGLAEGTVAAVAPRALAFGYDPLPEIAISSEAVLHMSDTPSEIVDDSGTVAAPVRSMFQLSLVGIRLILDVTWGKRSSAAVAYITGVGF